MDSRDTLIGYVGERHPGWIGDTHISDKRDTGWAREEYRLDRRDTLIGLEKNTV